MSAQFLTDWEVKPGGLVLRSGTLLTISCNHRKRGACGGCHARLWVALCQVQEAEPSEVKELIAAVAKAMHA